MCLIMLKQHYYNFSELIKLIFRRDKIQLLIWVMAIVIITVTIPPAFVELYSTNEQILAIAETMKNPVMTAMVGPGYGLDNYTIGAMMGHQMLLFTVIAVAVMSIFLVVRHTRGDEEAGRIEMIRSFSVGRLSNLSSIIVVSFIVNILLAIITGLGLFALNIESIDLEGSLLYGVVLGTTGFFFTTITALFVQLSTSSRTVIGYSFAFLGLTYIIRAIGDISSELLALISPLGLILRTEVYVNNYWWPVVVMIVISLITALIALYLNSVRDLEAGFLASKLGRRKASTFLQGTLGLSLKLLKTVIIGWIVTIFIIGVSYGSLLNEVESIFENNEMLKQMINLQPGENFSDPFLVMLMVVISMICAIPVLIIILKLRGEEKNNYLENILARSVSRTKMITNFLVISLVMSLIFQITLIFGLWSTAIVVMDNPIALSKVFKIGMLCLPAIWVIVGIAVVIIGWLPKMTGVLWFYLVYSFFTVYLGSLLQLPKWMMDISIFNHIPSDLVETADFAKIIIMLILTIIMIIIGYIGYKKRDIQGE